MVFLQWNVPSKVKIIIKKTCIYLRHSKRSLDKIPPYSLILKCSHSQIKNTKREYMVLWWPMDRIARLWHRQAFNNALSNSAKANHKQTKYFSPSQVLKPCIQTFRDWRRSLSNPYWLADLKSCAEREHSPQCFMCIIGQSQVEMRPWFSTSLL